MLKAQTEERLVGAAPVRETMSKQSVFSRHFPVFLILPAIVVIAVVVVFPLIFSLYTSFTDYNLLRPKGTHWIWFRNYAEIFRDGLFWRSFRNTIIFTMVAVNLEFIIGLLVAQLVSRVGRGQGVMRTILMMPMMVPPILAGFQFRWFFNDQVGLLNNFLRAIGLHGRPWLIDQPFGLLSIMAAEIWFGTPFVAIILLAGLLALPQEPFEAAAVDGASAFQKFRYITIPLLQPFIFIVMAIRSLDIARAFDIVQIMTAGGPAHRTELIWTLAYREAIPDSRFGYGSAISYIAIIVSLLFTWYLFKQLLKTRVGEQ